MELVKISELPIKEITTVDAYLPIIDNVGEDIENYRISLLNLFKTGGIINVNRTYGDTNYTLPTALAVIEPTLLTNGVFITFKGMDGWELYQKEGSEYIKYINRVDDELENGSDNPISNDAVTRMYYELLEGINNIAQITHKDLTEKNAEIDFQHVDTTTTKETLVNDDKVTIYDSETGKVVLTDKANVGGGGSTDITLKNENIGSATTVVVDTAYDWHVVSKTLGGAGVFTFDFANGVLPTKNKEYLIILKNDAVGTLTVTMPTGSITVGGVVFNFNNSISTFPLNAGKTAEVNVIAVYTGSTTCNIRITTQSSI